MDYNFREIEQKWQKRWVENGTYRVVEDKNKKKFYVLNMFPYPSGAGLHVGHPLGYIASDIYARYKRLKGFNVLNPMGYDAYGLPAEQYAIQTGQHPADCLQNSMPSRQVSILRKPLLPTSTAIVSSWIRSASHSIGIVRFAPVTPSIISGHSGLSSGCSRVITLPLHIRLSPLSN